MFTSRINVEAPLHEGGKWIVIEPLIYWSEKYRINVIVPIGFETDFASVPRLPLIYLIAGGTANAAAIVHDFLYQYGMRYHKIKERKEADYIFYEAMRDTNVPRWRAFLMWSAVRGFGRCFFDRRGRSAPTVSERAQAIIKGETIPI
jgi:hypothetical protein